MDAQYCLPCGTQIDRYKIIKPISTGGFSIVYLALDRLEKTKVILKEYLPTNLAKRLRNLTVVPLDHRKEQSLQKGRALFFQEANILATLKHPNIVNVINFFRAYDTVYMVMEYKKGKNLESYIVRHRGRLSERLILTALHPLLDGLELMHAQGYLHLDIKPANIHLQPGGQPILLDFGSVHRRDLSRRNQPGQVLTAGYAPIEQFNKNGYVGPWTDAYAIGATLRSCIEGEPPPDARTRHAQDKVTPTTILYRKKYSHALLTLIDWCLEVDPEARPQSIALLKVKLPPCEQDLEDASSKKKVSGG